MGIGMKSLKWEGFVTKNQLFPHMSTVDLWNAELLWPIDVCINS